MGTHERSGSFGSLGAALAGAAPQSSVLKPSLPRHLTKDRSHKGILRSMVRITDAGQMTTLNMDRSTVMRTTSVPARDLRLLDPRFAAPASILIRERALVLVLEHIRAIITHDRPLLVTKSAHSALGAAVGDREKDGAAAAVGPKTAAAFVNALHSRLTRCGAGEPAAAEEPAGAAGGGRLSRFSSSNNLAELAENGAARPPEPAEGDAAVAAGAAGPRKGEDASPRVAPEQEDLPFEFLVLEIALEITCNSLEHETLELDALGRRAVDALANKVTTTRLEQVRKVKGLISRLLTRVSQLKEELAHLLDDDDDMRQMYLTRKHVQQTLISSQGDPRALAASPDAEGGGAGGGRGPRGAEAPHGAACDGAGTPAPPVLLPPLPMVSPSQRSLTGGRRFNSRTFTTPFGSPPMEGVGVPADEELANDFDDMEDMLETFHEAISGTHSRLTSVRSQPQRVTACARRSRSDDGTAPPAPAPARACSWTSTWRTARRTSACRRTACGTRSYPST